jgi:predicted nucleotidyltransferase
MITTTKPDLGGVLFGKTRGAVLALLLGRPDEEFHVRHVVRLSGGGLGPVQRELKLLAEVGLLDRREVGRQVFYRASPQCPAFEELRGLVLKTVGVAGVLAAALRPLAGRIRAAFVFGSVASGEQRGESDVDVMVIGDVSFGEVARALAEAQRRLHREVNPSVYLPREFSGKLRAGNHFLTRLMERPKVFLIGDEHELSGVAEERLAASSSTDARRGRGAAGRDRSRPERQRRSESR